MSKDFPIIFEESVKGRTGVSVPKCDVPYFPIEALLGKENLRDNLLLPEVSELQTVRHFTNLSRRNYGIDNGFYPLGSCTMKYNPRVNETVAALPGFTDTHPLQPECLSQGALQLLHEVSSYLKAITGFDDISLQPAAGAQGEMTCLMLVKAYHESRGEGKKRTVVLVPDTAHGTNPASAARCGYTVKSIKTDDLGNTNIKELEASLDDSVAAMMLTSPTTLGVFETNVEILCNLVHKAGGLVFCDGANMNAIVGVSRPADMGFDCMHLNLHKTFSTPHGGGGPGCGAIGVKSILEPFLPKPVVKKVGEIYALDYDRPKSIGRVHSFFGNFLTIVRAWAFIRAYGGERLREVAEHAVLNANYVQARLKNAYPQAFNRTCMHECVLTGQPYRKYGVRTLDIAKRLIDYGIHPPTIYFPLLVPEAIMIEPTETESKETIDHFCDIMLKIAKEAEETPDLLHDAPHPPNQTRFDETTAARQLDVRWQPK